MTANLIEPPEDTSSPGESGDTQLEPRVIDEMEESYEFGPDPWLAERIRLDLDSNEVMPHRMPSWLDDLA